MTIPLVAENLRYLLWKEGVERRRWAVQLASWAKCNPSRAETLLRDGDLRPDEQQEIAQTVNHTEEELQYQRLVEDSPDSILNRNMRYLFKDLGRGQKGTLAGTIQVDPSTISKWLSGKQHPSPKHLNALVQYFGLPSDTNLEIDAVFLFLSPVSDPERRAVLHQWIDRLDQETLRKLFPALKRLLED